MSELGRSQSSALIRSTSVVPFSSYPLSRTYSVPQVNPYANTVSHARSFYWPNYTTLTSPYWPSRYIKDYSRYDQFWYDKYHYYNPFYYRSAFTRRYYQSDYLSNPYLWSGTSYLQHNRNHLYGNLSPYGRYNSYHYSSYRSPYRYYKYTY